jgi:hypothetical protein
LERNLVSRISPSSLLFYYGNIHSQRGQDGILAELFRRLGIGKSTFVEFGAWDGLYLSNCRYLFEKGWKGAFIEAHSQRFKDLERNYAKDRSNVTLINAMVGAPEHGVPGEPLKVLLEKNGVDVNSVSFVSIDVDGADLEVFEEIGFKPPVILLEGGFNFTPHLTDPIPAAIAWKNYQQPIAVIVRTVERLGYVPVCFFQDTYLVRKDLAGAWGRDAVSLYSDAFHFMSKGYRKELLDLRSKDRIIRDLEQRSFKKFHIDPLDYTER